MKNINLVINGKDLLVDVYSKDNKEMVAITPICQAIGIRPHMQAARLFKNSQFGPSHMSAPSAGGPQDMVFLPVEEVGMWLCTINARKVKAEVSEILIAFQKHCQVELTAALNGSAGIALTRQLQQQVVELGKMLIELRNDMGSMKEIHHQKVYDLTQEISQLREHQDKNLNQAKASEAGRALNAHKKHKAFMKLH